MTNLRLWNARVIDPAARTVLEHATVAIEAGRITEVGVARGDAPEGAIDIAGRTVLPGFIDAHTHLASDVSRSPGFGPPPQLHGEDPRPRELGYLLLVKSCEALLDGGITTIRDVGSFDDEAIVMRRAVELGLVSGPTILTCGRIVSVTAPGGRLFGSMYVEADGPWAVRQAVREQLRRGADYVKLMATGARSVERENPEPAQMTRDEVTSIVDEAHRLGLRVAAHAEGLDGARIAIEEGVDTIEHGFSLHREPRLLELMARQGQVLVPTLTTFHDLAERFAHEWLPHLVDQAKRQLEEAYLTLTAARDAGVTIAMGYDSGPPGRAHLRELTRMAEGGLGSWAALTAATAGGAAATGLADRGRLVPGSRADLVVVESDPLADVTVLTTRGTAWLVLKEGEAVAGRALDGPTIARHESETDDELDAFVPRLPCCGISARAAKEPTARNQDRSSQRQPGIKTPRVEAPPQVSNPNTGVGCGTYASAPALWDYVAALTHLPWFDRRRAESLDEVLKLAGAYSCDSMIVAIEGALGVKADHLSDAERVVVAVGALAREVNNGGYSQFFATSSAEYVPIIVESLTAIGCPTVAEITAEAIGVLNLQPGYAHADVQRVATELAESDDALLSALDERFYDCPDTIEDRLFVYIASHQHEIVLP